MWVPSSVPPAWQRLMAQLTGSLPPCGRQIELPAPNFGLAGPGCSGHLKNETSG